MEVTRYDEAPSYEAPGHFDVYGLRLQGFEVSKTRNFWMSISHFLPGGGCEYVATPLEKVYFVLDGEITVKTEEGEIVLKKYDSVYLAPDEARSIVNHTNSPATHARRHPVPGAARVLTRGLRERLRAPDGDDARCRRADGTGDARRQSRRASPVVRPSRRA